MIVTVWFAGGATGGVYTTLNFGSRVDLARVPQPGEQEVFAKESVQTTPSLVGSFCKLAVRVMGAEPA